MQQKAEKTRLVISRFFAVARSVKGREHRKQRALIRPNRRQHPKQMKTLTAAFAFPEKQTVKKIVKKRAIPVKILPRSERIGKTVKTNQKQNKSDIKKNRTKEENGNKQRLPFISELVIHTIILMTTKRTKKP